MAWMMDPPQRMISVHHLKLDKLYSQTWENRVPSSVLCSEKTHFQAAFFKKGANKITIFA